MADTNDHSIGEAINILRAEFPDVSVSKLRFLEGQGLINPARNPSGYREFSEQDLERLRYILRQQRDHYLPLKVIKSKLTAWERGEEPTLEPAAGPPPDAYFSASGVAMADEELARAAGLTKAQVRQLVDHGVLEPIDVNGQPVFRDEDLVIARAAHRLLSLGLEARHLRTFRLAAQREVDLLRGLTEPLVRHHNPENRRRAAEILADGAQAVRELQEAMVRSRLRRLLES